MAHAQHQQFAILTITPSKVIIRIVTFRKVSDGVRTVYGEILDGEDVHCALVLSGNGLRLGLQLFDALLIQDASLIPHIGACTVLHGSLGTCVRGAGRGRGGSRGGALRLLVAGLACLIRIGDCVLRRRDHFLRHAVLHPCIVAGDSIEERIIVLFHLLLPRLFVQVDAQILIHGIPRIIGHDLLGLFAGHQIVAIQRQASLILMDLDGQQDAVSRLLVAILILVVEQVGIIGQLVAFQVIDHIHPQFDADAEYDVVATGLNASPGAAVGEAVFSAEAAVEAEAEGRKTVLVRWETTPDDLAGMIAAEGILTSHGGKTSHAAVIARGMGAPCVCGVDALKIDADAKQATIAGTDLVIREGDMISLDGTTGIVVLGAVELVQPELAGDLDTILEWADEVRTMGVRANADNPEDAELARSFGAQGIGLCRTEHMFLGDRKQIIQTFILNEDESIREKAVSDLFAAQTGDFLGMFKAMDGLPVIVRLLDPPLHEFLESPRALDVEIARLEATGADPAVIAQKRHLMEQIDSFAEQNPMLGLRGCRLAITYPVLPRMQVRAIATAMAQLKKEGFDPKPEIMIPLVSVKPELEKLRALAEEVIAEVAAAEGVELEIPIGTMIELPRAAVTANEIAQAADFFSFGTNDLTQTTFGFSRDDVESEFVPQYLAERILPYNPFATVDPGVAKLVEMGVELGHEGNPDIVCGVCGEHGGDPDSVKIFYGIGLDYVSCSPYRVPLARLAAAQAALADK